MMNQPFKAQWLLYVPPGLTFKNFTFCPQCVFTCHYNNNGLVSISEIERVYCAVQTECLNTIWVNLSFIIVLYHLSCHTKRLSGRQNSIVPNVTDYI